MSLCLGLFRPRRFFKTADAGTECATLLRCMQAGAGLHLRRHVRERELRLALSGRKQDRESCRLEHDGWQHVYS